MDFEAYTKLTSPDCIAETNAYIRQRVAEHSSIQDGAKLCKQLHIPYLEIELPKGNYEAMIQEARTLSNRFVSHRDYDSKGWKSLCLHGIDAENTLSFDKYGYTNEKEVPYQWTSISDLCPITTEWLKKIFALGFFEEFYRVRFMWLEPGGYIKFHWDRPPGQYSLGPMNIALNMPKDCQWIFKKWGQVPFRPESAFLVDISNEHSVWNKSNEDRIHIIIHGKYGPAYYKAISQAAAKIQALPRPSRPKIAYAIWNYLPSFSNMELFSKCRSLTLHFLRLKSRQITKFNEDHSLSRMLNEALKAGNDWCVVMMPGNFPKYDFFPAVEQVLEKASGDILLFAHILDRKERGFGVHEQFMIVNVKLWKEIGAPHFLPPAQNDHSIRQASRSTENVHDDYTPLWLKPTSEERKFRPRVFAWNIIDAAMRNNFTVENIPQSIRKQKTYLYPEQNPGELSRCLESMSTVNFDFNQASVSDHQRKVLQDIYIEANGYGKKTFLFNTEGYWDVKTKKNPAQLDSLYSVASGFKDLFILHRHGFHEKTKLTYFDISHRSLQWKKILYEKWDGQNFPEFYERLSELQPDLVQDALFSASSDEVIQHWKRELTIWGGEKIFQENFLAVKKLPKTFINVDIVQNAGPLLQHISADPEKNLAIWYSNCFNYTPCLAKHLWDLPWIERQALFFLTSLHGISQENHHKNIVLYGEDIVFGARCATSSDQVREIFS